MSEWISVKDRLPDGHRDVLAIDAHSQYHVCRWTGTHLDHPVYKHERFTHWHALPAPPEPKLTVREALREAVSQLDVLQRNGFSVFNEILPRLRAALESEE